MNYGHWFNEFSFKLTTFQLLIIILEFLHTQMHMKQTNAYT